MGNGGRTSATLTEKVIHRVFTIYSIGCTFSSFPKRSIRTSREVPDNRPVFWTDREEKTGTCDRFDRRGSGLYREGRCTLGITARYPSTILPAVAGRRPRSKANVFCPRMRRSCRWPTAAHRGYASVSTGRSPTGGRISGPSRHPSGPVSGTWLPGCSAASGVQTQPDRQAFL